MILVPRHQLMTSWYDSWYLQTVLGLLSPKKTLGLQPLLMSAWISHHRLTPLLGLSHQQQLWKQQKGQERGIHLEAMSQALNCPRMTYSQGFERWLGSEWSRDVHPGKRLLGAMTGTEMREGAQEGRGLLDVQSASQRTAHSVRQPGTQHRRRSRKGRALG